MSSKKLRFAVICQNAQTGVIFLDNLYNYIESKAKEAGYKNMTEFCKSANIPRATMSELKAGRTKSLSGKTAASVSNSLNIPIDVLWGGSCDVPSFSVTHLTNGISIYKGFSQAIEGKLSELNDGFRLVFQTDGLAVIVDNNSTATESDIQTVVSAYNHEPSPLAKNSPVLSSEGALDEEIIKKLIQLSPEEIARVNDFVQGLIAARSAQASPRK